jgi:hypothetical protein
MSTPAALISLMVLFFSQFSFAITSVRVVGTRAPLIEAAIMSSLKLNIDMSQYREARIHMIANDGQAPDHAVIYLFSNKYHRFDLVSANLDSSGNVISIDPDYKMQPSDRKPVANPPHCPDPSVEFIAFAPNDDALEQSITVGVANSAIAHGLKTVQLLKADATRANYLNYMVCPNLKGNFYDGDANPMEITTVDGSINAEDIRDQLNGAFHFHVTNIWLACQAYNNPILSSMTLSAQSQKYAAGKNDLEVGPSDQAAACAMKAALDGKAMTAAFQACYTQFDNSADQWGFSGNGSDYFGH